MNVYDGLAIAFLGVWFIASVIVQKEDGPLVSRIVRFDLLGLLPNCRFFAPKPVSHDLMLFVRCSGDVAQDSRWKPIISHNRSHWSFIWNPQHRIRKTIHDLIESLQQQEGELELRHLSYPYLTLLEAASAMCANETGTHVQFVVAASAGFEDETPNLVFASHLHKLPK